MPPVQQANAEAPAQNRFRQRLDLCCEWGIHALVLLILLWGPLAFGGVPEGAFVVIQGLIVLALGLWAVRLWAQPSFRLLWPPVCWAVFIFVLYAIVRCRNVLITYPARTDLIQALVYAALFFVVLNNFHHRRSATAITLILIFFGMVLAWVAVYQFGTHYPRVWGAARRVDYVARGGATYLNPNHFAGLLAMLIPLALSYTLMSRFKPMVKVAFAYCGLAMLAGVAVSLSRGGIIAVAASLVIFCLVLLCERGQWLPALGLAVGLAAVALCFEGDLLSLTRRFESTVVGNHLTDHRPYYWHAALQMFRGHPLWGAGPGSFDSTFAQYRPRAVQIRPMYAHNDYLNTLSEWGAAGMAIIVAVCLLLFLGAWKSWKAFRQIDPDTRKFIKSDKSAFLLGACVGLAAILVHSVVEFNMHVPANAVVAVTLMALIAAQGRLVTEAGWKNPGNLGRILLTATILGAMAWLSAQGIARGREAYWRWRSEDEAASWNDRLTGLEKAYAAQPDNYENSYHLGEYYRIISEQDEHNDKMNPLQAMQWYARSMAENPLDAFVPVRYGMCLDAMGRTEEATLYFNLAERMDPNNAKVAYFMAGHCLDQGNLWAARNWYMECLGMSRDPLALSGLTMVSETLARLGKRENK